jgi:anti-anti-sigma factor
MKQPENEIEIKTQGDITIFNIHGDVTSLSEPFFKDAYACMDLHGADRIVLNFDGDVYINSGGILVLSQILVQAREKNQKIAITGLSEHLKKIFNMVGITKLAEIHDTLDESLACF